jgi:hypothetical protein
MKGVSATIVAVEKLLSTTYCEFVFVALVNKHAMRIGHIVVRGMPRSTIFFRIISKNGMIFGKKIIEHKMCVLIFSATYV